MSKHTPGPWLVGYWSGRCNKESHKPGMHPGLRGNDPCVYDPYFVEGSGIASANGSSVVSVNGGELVMLPEDARLISAAPELLEALEAMLNAEPGYEWGGYSTEELAAMEKAQAAIAKATGD